MPHVNRKNTDTYTWLVVLFASLLVGCLLAASYDFVAIRFGWLHWVAAASIHTLISFIVLFKLQRLRPLSASNSHIWLYFLPAVIVFVGATSLACLTKFLFPEGAESVAIEPSVLYWVFWIPIVEELVFRVGFGALFRERLGAIFGSYYSALFFAYMHSFPTFDRLVSLDVGIALGPLLLGLACEYLWVRSGSLCAIIGLHAVCNATGLIFAALDSRWLKWLQVFYQ